MIFVNLYWLDSGNLAARGGFNSLAEAQEWAETCMTGHVRAEIIEETV